MIAARTGRKITPMNSVTKAKISSNQIISAVPPVPVATRGFHSLRKPRELVACFGKLDIKISFHTETNQNKSF
jgi:hypothetical protein